MLFGCLVAVVCGVVVVVVSRLQHDFDHIHVVWLLLWWLNVIVS
jgi:hypothetical protein